MDAMTPIKIQGLRRVELGLDVLLMIKPSLYF